MLTETPNRITATACPVRLVPGILISQHVLCWCDSQSLLHLLHSISSHHVVSSCVGSSGLASSGFASSGFASSGFAFPASGFGAFGHHRCCFRACRKRSSGRLFSPRMIEEDSELTRNRKRTSPSPSVSPMRVSKPTRLTHLRIPWRSPRMN